MTSHFTLMALTAAGLLWLAFMVRRSRIPVRHRWRRRQAQTMAEQLRGRDRSQPPQLLYARLRAMDPLAFEELLLESFERRGHKVIRNHRYTGDGGIDGQVVIDGAIWLIQAKRYAGTIRSEHVVAFETLCQSRGCRGLFIHTGRTGPRSRKAVRHSGTVRIISGRELLGLLNGEALPSLSAVIEPTLSMLVRRRSD